jgi:hypothetical protein
MKYVDPYVLIDNLVSKLSKRLTYLYKADKRNSDEYRYLSSLRRHYEQMYSLFEYIDRREK